MLRHWNFQTPSSEVIVRSCKIRVCYSRFLDDGTERGDYIMFPAGTKYKIDARLSAMPIRSSIFLHLYKVISQHKKVSEIPIPDTCRVLRGKT